MSAVKDCLISALDVIRQDDQIDPTIKDDIEGTFKRLIDNRNLSDEQALAKSMYLLRDAKRNVYIGTITKRASDLKKTELFGKFNTIPPEQRVAALREWMEPSMLVKKRDGPAVSEQIAAAQNTAMGSLHELWGRIFTKFGNDTDFAKVFNTEMHGIDTGDVEAKNLVKQYRKVMEGLLTRIRDAGSYVGHVDDHALRSHSFAKIQTDRENWKQFMIQNLDQKEHPDPATTADLMFDKLATSDLVEPEAAIISMSRKLKWKSADAELDYFYRWGEGGFAEQLASNVRLIAKRAVLVENYGPAPTRTIGALLTESRKAARVAGQPDKMLGHERAAQSILDAQLGTLETPDNQTLANWSSVGRNWMSTILLGQTALSNIAQDTLATLIRSRFHTGGFGQGVISQLHAMKSIAGDENALAYAKEMGWFFDSVAAGVSARIQAPYSTGTDTKGFSAKAALFVQRVTGSLLIEKSLRASFGFHVARTLAAQSRNAWSELDPRYTRVLENKGIDEKVWEKVRKNIVVNEVGAVDFKALRDGDRRILLSFLTGEMEAAIVRPGDFDRAFLSGGAKRGTIPGEIITSMTQFMAWPIAFFRQQVAFEWQMGFSGFVGFGIGMTFAGLMTTQLYAIAAGQPAFEWDSPTLWKRAIARSGLLSPAGEMMMDFITTGEQKAAFGVVGETLGKGILGLNNAAWDVIEGENDKAIAELLKAGRPFAGNVWFANAIINKGMDAIMEELDPEYIRRRERRWQNEGRVE